MDLIKVKWGLKKNLMDVRGECDGVREEWPESGSTGGKRPPDTEKN